MSEFAYLPPPTVLVPPSGLMPLGVPLAQQQQPLPVPQPLAVPPLLVPGAAFATTATPYAAPPGLQREAKDGVADARSSSGSSSIGTHKTDVEVTTAGQAAVRAAPSYHALVYPALRDVLPYSTVRVGLLGTLQQPIALAAPHEVAVSAELMAAVPRPPPPDFVVFGGARYSAALSSLARQRASHSRAGRMSTTGTQRQAEPAPRDKVCSRGGQLMEQDRLLFMSAQLQVARNFLMLTARSTSTTTPPGNPSAAHASGNHNDDANVNERAEAADADGETKDDDGNDGEVEMKDVAKSNLCSLAYWGTPQQLQAALDRPEMTCAINAVGTVCYRGREWALKRSGEHYTLGFGQRATPLQYAAAAGRTDNVFVLLRAGARDDERPRLRDMLSQPLYKAIAPLLRLHHGAATPATRPRSRDAAITTDGSTQAAST